ncbi:MAG: YifB family Mg chelatase-like AAA ATPase [Peptococcaceae bacterium]|nr:YifB family Mg chelatase-like AAA ATPase [Peptococcaceae bacterium]
MLAIVNSAALEGLKGYPVEVEVDVAGGLPAWEIVGLPDTAVREAKDRVRAAIRNAGYDFPSRRITVNLAPADVKKEGPGFDLPIAVGVLAASEQINDQKWRDCVCIGELSLDGSLRPVNGILPIVASLVRQGQCRFLVPLDNAAEAAMVAGAEIYGVRDLAQVVRFLQGQELLDTYSIDKEQILSKKKPVYEDLSDVKGHQAAKRALEVAAAGGHNLVMLGSPGSGKTMLAKRLPGILPDLSFEEALEITMLYSLAGLLPPGEPLVTQRPFRSPHHTSSTVALTGGGRIPKPGEISLAHNGVLFLDELPEFHRDTLEALRQPLEEGNISISRVTAAITYPARVMLVASMNPCPCGFYGDPLKECSCTPYQIQRYLGRISGPLLDRIDIQIEVPRLSFQELACETPGESSAAVKKRVEEARAIQRERLQKDGLVNNAQMGVKHLKKYCTLTGEARGLLKQAFEQLDLSARAHDRILKVARTIADLEKSDKLEVHHIAEAIQYRTLDRKFWGQ